MRHYRSIHDIFSIPLTNHRLSPSRCVLTFPELYNYSSWCWAQSESSLYLNLWFFCCRNGSPETTFSSPVLPSRHGAQTMSLLLFSADVLSVRSCSSPSNSAFPLSLCWLIQAINSNSLTSGQRQPSSQHRFVCIFYSPMP